LPIDHREREQTDQAPDEYDASFTNARRCEVELTGDDARDRPLVTLWSRKKRQLDVGECVADAAGEQRNTQRIRNGIVQ